MPAGSGFPLGATSRLLEGASVKEQAAAPTLYALSETHPARTMLKKILTATFCFLITLPVAGALAQTGTITGVVTDSTTGDPIPGVSILVAGTQIGTSTDANGEYDLTGVPAGQQTLEATFVGYRDERVPVDVQPNATTTRDIQIAEATVELEDVVVTALGRERSERAVASSVQQVDGADLDRTNQSNFIGTLDGKVAGASIRNSNKMGGSNNIVLRGYSSITGTNQPLIVIDGVVIDNSSAESGGATTQGYGGFDYGNAAQSINPNNIKSVSVLKGPSAAALYGSRASNGVIQITTKSGATTEGEIGVSFSSSVTAQQPYNFMNYQNQYGGGASGSTFQTLQGAPYQLDGEDDQYVAQYAVDESWGPRLDGRPVRQWYSWDDVNGMEGEATPWVAHPNAVENFMRTGMAYSNNLAFSQNDEDFSYRLGLNTRNQQSSMPNGNMQRYQVNFNGTADLSDDLTATAFGRYGYTDAKGRSGSGYGFEENPFAAFNTFTQRQLDYGSDSYMRDYQRPNGQQRGWNYAGVAGAQGLETSFQYTDNPYVNRYENFQTDDEQRFFGKAELQYDLTRSLSGRYTVSTDYRTERRQDRRSSISTGGPAGYSESVIETQEINTELRMDYSTQLTDAIDVTAFGAGRVRYETFEDNAASTTNGLSAPGAFTVENSIGRPNTTDFFREKVVYSAYGSVNLGYNDLFYLEATLRNDWSSALPEDNNSYIYPSVLGNFIFTELDALQGQSILSFGKIRASWARVGSDTGPYRLGTTFPLDTPFQGQALQQVDRSANNPNLKPEQTTGIEVGADLEFFENRVQLNTTYYRDVTRDQILSTQISGASGVNTSLVNAGKVVNRGLEASLTVTPVATEDLQWDLTANFNKNVNTVEELAEGIDTYQIAEFSIFGPTVEAREGAAYGAIVGQALQRDQDGDIIYSRGGFPRTTNSPEVLGNFQPDWTGGLSTTISYGNLTASALVSGQMGGDVYSLSNKFGMYSGLLTNTVKNDQRETGVVPDGVVIPQGEDLSNSSNWQGTPYSDVSGRLPAATYWKNWFFAGGVGGPAGRAYLYDATHLKLQEVSLSYQLPQKWFGGFALRRASVAVTGSNLGFLYKEAANIDPTATLGAGNVQGIEAAQIPPQRQYTLRVNLNF
jgi:TonB-linked SusC/RagA family outer membrane protein